MKTSPMRTLRAEIAIRFPEIRATHDEEDGNYTLMQRLVEWLRGMRREGISTDIVERVRSFKEWCEEQPRKESAENDVWTIFIVGFWERLFESDSTRLLIPHLMSREEVIANRTYLESWVGADNYQIALGEYEQTV
jgi:hypothetical protein